MLIEYGSRQKLTTYSLGRNISFTFGITYSYYLNDSIQDITTPSINNIVIMFWLTIQTQIKNAL